MEDLSGVAYCLMHPARLKIIQLLREKPSTFIEISMGTGFSRQLIAYHLSHLETAHLLESKYILTDREGKGYATRQ